MDALEAPAGHPPELEARLSAVEARLAALGNALRARDTASIDLHAVELHRALASAVEPVLRRRAQRPAAGRLRNRLASAGGQVAAQREVARPRDRRARSRDRRLLPRGRTAALLVARPPTAACSRAA
jgi:hypothetical protein